MFNQSEKRRKAKTKNLHLRNVTEMPKLQAPSLLQCVSYPSPFFQLSSPLPIVCLRRCRVFTSFPSIFNLRFFEFVSPLINANFWIIQIQPV